MTSEGHPWTRPLYLQACKGAETEKFAGGNRKTSKGQTEVPAHVGGA